MRSLEGASTSSSSSLSVILVYTLYLHSHSHFYLLLIHISLLGSTETVLVKALSTLRTPRMSVPRLLSIYERTSKARSPSWCGRVEGVRLGSDGERVVVEGLLFLDGVGRRSR
jgi:hypothetical protein